MIRSNSFEPIYSDIHIHTSEQPNKIKSGIKYDLQSLIKNIDNISKGYKKLISFTDHNVINKNIYLESFPNDFYLILGVELHVSYVPNKKPYHCHILFNCDINEKTIDAINTILDELYPMKEITPNNYKNVPKLEEIVNKFNDYSFILLPHGGQNHSTFNKAIPSGAKLDNIMEKMLYYNQFDGFTSRSTKGKDTTINYFKQLGIDEFTNLITCSDNYNPKKYPDTKVDTSEKFVPTWIFSEPSFDGLKMALSENTRLYYGLAAPKIYEEYIHSYKLSNDLLDIDVNFQPGLNVVIGESSSGKSLLVDSLVNLLDNNDTKYSSKYNFDSIKINNPAEFLPHYISQNYIMDISKNDKIEDIPLIKKLFGPKYNTQQRTKKALEKLDGFLLELVDSIEKIEQLQLEIKALTNLEQTILIKNDIKNPIINLFPPSSDIDKLGYSFEQYSEHLIQLDEILKFSKKNAFIGDVSNEIKTIKDKLKEGYEKNRFELYIRKILKKNKDCFDKNYNFTDAEIEIKTKNYEKVLLNLSKYLEEKGRFYCVLKNISNFKYKINSKPLRICGHQLFIENNLEITEDLVLEALNEHLKNDSKIEEFMKIQPSNLFLDKLNGTYRITDYNILKSKIYSKFTNSNKYKYKILTSDNRKWEELSPGWKTAILTELILQFNDDVAPLIIDQPEDNLANKYINTKLIDDIKSSKLKKQVIIVTHNATIPILADAQNIISCKLVGNKIVIRSNYLENKIDDNYCLDLIADITDGGKKSIRKRFKKYNIKSYKED